MSTYVVRIELHGAGRNYSQLHTWMQNQGFLTTIRGRNGAVCKLPTATYQIDSSRSEIELCDWLIANLPDCGSVPAPWILVVKSDGIAWARLDQVAKAA